MLHNRTQFVAADSEAHSTPRRMMLFELSPYGHHASYIRHLVRYWSGHALSGHLYIIVAPLFLQKHSDVVAMCDHTANLSLTAISSAEEAQLPADTSNFLRRKIRAWQEWKLICTYARQLNISHCFLDSFDFFQWPFLWGEKPPCPVSGIYFKPTFHYPTFESYDATLIQFLKQTWEKIRLSVIFRQSHLHRLFCLDPFAVEQLNNSFAQGKAVTLADPVSVYPRDRQPADLKTHLDIQPQRRVFLLFGDLTPRKGIHQLLAALALLPDVLLRSLCILIAGRCSLQAQQAIDPKIEQLRQTSAVQILTHYGFVEDKTVQAYFQMADVILAPYQKHVGMSGILLQAAAAGKPVLSSNYGLMGELVRRYQLGVAVDSTQPAHLATGLSTLLTQPLTQLHSVERSHEFAQQNTVEKFASTIFSALGYQA